MRTMAVNRDPELDCQAQTHSTALSMRPPWLNLPKKCYNVPFTSGEETFLQSTQCPKLGSVQTVSFFDLLMHADPVVKGVMLVLTVTSIACWAIAIEKLIRVVAFSREVLAFEQAGRGLEKSEGWLVERMAAIADAEPAANGETRSEFNARLERSLQVEVSAQLQRLQSGLPLLATVGSTAPFVGLFGTVWGIMRSFTGIAAAKDTSLAVVAPGIAEALFATAFSLVAAIPAVIFYNQANATLNRLAEQLSATAIQFAKIRIYGSSRLESFPLGAATLERQGLTNGRLGAR
jgi:biopolymer transport protein TolQ